MKYLAIAFPLVLLCAPSASAQGLSPDEAVKRMKLPEGFSARCVASEPMIRQPVSISFDNRGRLWVLQYLQYPNYAGLKPVKQDQYLRTIWDKVPDPPPKGPKGLDRITILSDPDEHGVFRKSQDFVTGLNIASGFCIGHGGVYVAQPPYILFYPDKNEDDVPDGDPEVLLTGFGMDDTHSLANSLQWGPDGWLYGAAGSTSNCAIKNPNHPKDAVVEFQQGIWRFHPKTKKFELFSEGGGNTYGLDFDKNGQVIAGTNWGGFAMLHQMQGAYYVKGFAKHGPLHNPHTYGYFDHVPYTGFRGGHVTCGGIIYQAEAYPKEYRDQYIAANLLSNAVYWHKIEPVKSSFKARHGGELLEVNDPWFRPVDLLQGPDGCVYVVDFYDRRAAHLDPVDNWDKTNGRIYRIEYRGGPKYPAFDLRKKTTPELLELLKHPNVWYRREARQLLAERQNKSAYETLRKWALREKGQLALEALWALYVSGGTNEEFLVSLLDSQDEYMQAWAVRLLGEQGEVTRATGGVNGPLYKLARESSSAVVLAQLASSARRFDSGTAEFILVRLTYNPASKDDPHMPLLIWWGLETLITRDGKATFIPVDPLDRPINPVSEQIAERWAQRLASSDVKGHLESLDDALTFSADSHVTPILRGILKSLESSRRDSFPDNIKSELTRLWAADRGNPLLLEIMARIKDPDALTTLRDRATNPRLSEEQQLKAVRILSQIRDPKSKAMFLTRLAEVKPDTAKVALLAALEGYDDPKIGETVLAAYPGYSPTVKKRALQLLLARSAWGLQLFKALDAGKFLKADVSVDQARVAVGLGDKKLTALVEKHFGKLAPATAGEKQARIAAVNLNLSRMPPGDAARGKVLFTKTCAACHTLHGEGGKAGPDLTTADRKNRGYMLAQIVDPSGYIRPEFVVQNILTTDERKLLGIAKEMGESVELTNYVDSKVVSTLVPKKDIVDIRPSAISLMPEKLIDTMTDAEIADLFAYLQSEPKNLTPQPPSVGGKGGEAPLRGGEGVGRGLKRDAKKLKVCLVSGSFEYKSDASLAVFQKFLEANFPVECSRAFAKSDKHRDLPGIENLEKCDVAIFFTRRLQIDGPSLDAVKQYVASKKPIVGIRTASHGFQNWLAMDREVLGGDYKSHYGPGVADVRIVAKQKDHPILKGISEFKTNGSLYKNPNVAADVTVLLRGYMGKETEPVAWVREKDGRRVFYTSLGHPDDFKNENFTRLLVNGLAWAAKRELKK